MSLPTTHFTLDLADVEATNRRAAALGPTTLTSAARRAEAGDELSDEELVALAISSTPPTEELLALARSRRSEVQRIETFSPLYLTNECDAECLMCGMRRTNRELIRETATDATVAEQLRILHRRGLRAVALLTGEYHIGPFRRLMIDRAATALREALSLGFRHVLVNIGALDAPEYEVLLDGIPRESDGRVGPRVTMCTFQETYEPNVYARFMGDTPSNPRADFRRRLTNFDRACDSGMRVANPGVLLGLNVDVGFELIALLTHVRHLRARGMEVYVSLPRLRRASGTSYPGGVSDDVLCRIVAVLALAIPDARVVISTREPPTIQRRLLPVIGVLTPGSPGVAPYTEAGARFELEASQFEVLDHRSIEAILDEHRAAGATIDCYEPSGRTAPA
jgi:2-iminoacetate synthase